MEHLKNCGKNTRKSADAVAEFASSKGLRMLSSPLLFLNSNPKCRVLKPSKALTPPPPPQFPSVLHFHLATFALVKLLPGSRSYTFRLLIGCRFLTLRKQVLYENMCLNRYVNFYLKINSINSWSIARSRMIMYTYLSNSSFILPFWFIQRHVNQNFSWATVSFFYLFFPKASTSNVLWSKIDLIVRRSSARFVIF